MSVERATWAMDQMLTEFAAENQELMEALEVFGIASAEYERAMSALYPATVYTGVSTHESP
ncbi:MAG: hypothetical protein ACREM3_21135 [Candidatus Rokuibacteriota bacterium]